MKIANSIALIIALYGCAETDMALERNLDSVQLLMREQRWIEALCLLDELSPLGKGGELEANLLRAECLVRSERGADTLALAYSLLKTSTIDAEGLLAICDLLSEEEFLAECNELARVGAVRFPASSELFSAREHIPEDEVAKELSRLLDL